MSDGELICLGFSAGYIVAWLLNRKPPRIDANLIIDREALTQMNLALVNTWLNEHGMTWMPKGAVYDPEKDVK